MFHIIADTVYIATLNESRISTGNADVPAKEKVRSPILGYILPARAKR